ARDRWAMPASKTPSVATIIVNVHSARLTRGSANSGTPLLTASTPVIAVHPLAKDRISSQNVTALVELITAGSGTIAFGCPPLMIERKTPTLIAISSVATNTYVGK